MMNCRQQMKIRTVCDKVAQPNKCLKPITNFDSIISKVPTHYYCISCFQRGGILIASTMCDWFPKVVLAEYTVIYGIKVA